MGSYHHHRSASLGTRVCCLEILQQEKQYKRSKFRVPFLLTCVYKMKVTQSIIVAMYVVFIAIATFVGCYVGKNHYNGKAYEGALVGFTASLVFCIMLLFN
jgi:hypothetical protein